MAQVETDSKKCIVSTDGLLADEKCTALSNNEYINKCKWARSSDEVNRVKKLEADFLATAKISKQLALKQKKLIQRKLAKMQKLLDTCK